MYYVSLRCGTMAGHNYRYLEQDFEDQPCGLGGLTCALVVTRCLVLFTPSRCTVCNAVRFTGLDGTFTTCEPVRRYSLFGEFIM